MERRISYIRPTDRHVGGRHESLRALLRRRWVQALLVLAAALPPFAMCSALTARENVVVLDPQRAALPGMGAESASSVEGRWRRRAVERESRRLAEAYGRQGYRISLQLARDIARAALVHEIDLEIAFGLVRAESGFRSTATSPVGAIGMTQLMPRTAAWIEPGTTARDLRDPQKNLHIGFKYLRYLIDRYEGDTRLALLAYNRGPGTVDRALKNGANPDNGYAGFVMGERNHRHRLFTSAPRTRAAARPAMGTARRARSAR